MVHLLGMAVSYYNRVSNKWHVKALTFKALMQSVNHLLSACSNEHSSKSTFKECVPWLFIKNSFCPYFIFWKNLPCNGNVKGQKWPNLSNNEAFLTIMFHILCSILWARLLAILSLPRLSPPACISFYILYKMWIIVYNGSLYQIEKVSPLNVKMEAHIERMKTNRGCKCVLLRHPEKLFGLPGFWNKSDNQ